MKHFIIGTAGHVDHGKTALVKAITGTDTDRLREEKERGISIELGFASLLLPGGHRAGIVDVPGHERFIKNMLAGVGGIDLVLLIIAADEGVMPQTREHLDIIQLLQVDKGVVVLTKIDLVDSEWLELVREEVRGFLAETALAEAPLVAVSSVTGEGFPELLAAIEKVAREVKPKSVEGPVRLPVDRVFSVTGFGTVVTGTLLAGVLRVGEQVEILPQGVLTRVRSLQVHGEKEETAGAGQRVAVNLAGVDVEQVSRGSVVARYKSLVPSHYLDVRLFLLKSAGKNLRNRARVRFYLGTKEALGRVKLLDFEELEPGGRAYAQLELEENVVAAKGDPFVIRSYSPMRTIGGGLVIDPAPRKHKRFRPEVIAALSIMEKGSPEDLLEQYLINAATPNGLNEIAGGTGLLDDEINQTICRLIEQRKVRKVSGEGRDYFMAEVVYRKWAGEITGLLNTYHRDFPLREGYPKEELRSRRFPALNNKVFQFVLQNMEREGILQNFPQTLALPSFIPQPAPDQAELIKQVEQQINESGFQPPFWSEVCKKAGLKDALAQEALQYLLKQGVLVKLGDDLYFHRDALAEARRRVAAYLAEKGELSVGETRDLLGTSRKFTLPLLEYFDRAKLTRRVGDKRLPGKTS